MFGLEHLFPNGLSLRAGTYHKRMSKLQDEYYSFHDIDELFPEARDDLVRLSLDGSTSRGIETYLKYDTGNRLSWWLSYVLSEATDDVTDIHYEGTLVKKTGELPRAWDQRHTLNIDANYRLSEAWQFNAAWQHRTGWLRSSPWGAFREKMAPTPTIRTAVCSAVAETPPIRVST